MFSDGTLYFMDVNGNSGIRQPTLTENYTIYPAVNIKNKS